MHPSEQSVREARHGRYLSRADWLRNVTSNRSKGVDFITNRTEVGLRLISSRGLTVIGFWTIAISLLSSKVIKKIINRIK